MLPIHSCFSHHRLNRLERQSLNCFRSRVRVFSLEAAALCLVSFRKVALCLRVWCTTLREAKPTDAHSLLCLFATVALSFSFFPSASSVLYCLSLLSRVSCCDFKQMFWCRHVESYSASLVSHKQIQDTLETQLVFPPFRFSFFLLHLS